MKVKHTGLIVIILAAILLEVISALQYNYARKMLEESLEKNAFRDLVASALRIQNVLSNAETAVNSQLWHAEKHLHEKDYINNMVYNIVKDDNDNIIGACIAFKPYFFPSEGKFYEPYSRQWEDSISLSQIGSERHDYTQKDFYKIAMKGDTTKWNEPYLDAEGAHDVVTSYAIPIHDKNNLPVGLIGVDLTTKWIGEVVNLHHTYPSSFSLVLSPSGNLIAGPDKDTATPELVSRIAAMINDSTVTRELKANGRVTGFPFFDSEKGEHGHVYYARKKDAPHWQMVTVCYDKEVFGNLEKMRHILFWLALAGLAVLGIIINLFARNNRRLQKTKMAQERISSELRIANDIQMQMLPRENSISRSDINVSGLLTPAREVGGDLYDFFLRDEKLFFCIGDVSGKGVPSAMLMAVAHTLFRSASAHENNPSRIIRSINETCCQGNDSNMFITFFIGVLDLPTGRLRYCNAGHDIPIIIEKGQPLSAKPNVPIGVFDDFEYETQETMIDRNSTLFLYTDGLTEAMNQQHKQYGIGRLMEFLNKNKGVLPKQLLFNIEKGVHEYMGESVQNDDLTMLSILYSPKESEIVLRETLTLKNDLHQVGLLSAFVKEFSTKLKLEQKLAANVRIAIEEAVVNVMEYAYPTGTDGDINIEVTSDGHDLKIIIIDTGIPFDPTKATNADTTLSVEERPIGGLGIYLVRQLMDSINYERIDGKNVLTLRLEIKNNNK